MDEITNLVILIVLVSTSWAVGITGVVLTRNVLFMLPSVIVVAIYLFYLVYSGRRRMHVV